MALSSAMPSTIRRMPTATYETGLLETESQDNMKRHMRKNCHSVEVVSTVVNGGIIINEGPTHLE